MEQIDIISKFFDSRALSWDILQKTNFEVTDRIISLCNIRKDMSVLDVATGTGFLIPYYFNAGCRNICAVDLSPVMISVAKEKFSQLDCVRFINSDINNFNPKEKFDRIIIYNAFPHFVDQKRTIEHLCSLLSTNGLIVISHGASREEINSFHYKIPVDISHCLLPATEVAKMFPSSVEITNIIDNNSMYFISAQNKN